MRKRKFKDNKEFAKEIFGRVAIILLAIVAIVTISQMCYTLNENEDAVVFTFGKPSLVSESGLHFAVPIVQDVYKCNTAMQGLSIGYDAYNNPVENDSLMITKDFNFVNVDFYLEWYVADPIAYYCASDEPQLILSTLAKSVIRDTVGSYNIDEVLTTGKAEIQAAIKDALMKRIESEKIGIAVNNITLQDAEPPTQEVVAAFKAVEDAKQKAEELENVANKYRSENIPAAQAESNAILQKAEAQKQERIKEAEGQIARFKAMYEEYMKSPEITKTRMYYEAMEALLPFMKVVIQGENGSVINIVGDSDAPVVPVYGTND
jgi:membrane protease subunit HflK